MDSSRTSSANSTIQKISPENLGGTLSSFPTKADRKRIDLGLENEGIWRGNFYEENGERGAFRLKKYFEQDPEKEKILALSINVARIVITKSTRFFVGGKMKFSAVTENKKSQKEIQKAIDEIVQRSELRKLLREEANALQVHGYSTMRSIAEKDGEKVKSFIEGVSFANTFPIFDYRGRKTQHIIGKYLKKGNGVGQETFFYAQRYFKENGVVKIAHELYKASGYDVKEKASFSVLGEGYSELEGKIETSVLEEIPIVQIDDLKLGSEVFPTGVIDQIRSPAEEICDCLTRISTQFIKHLSAKIAVPKNALEIEITDDGREVVKSTNLEVIPVDEGDIIPQYITNSNPLIEQQFKQLEKLLNLVAAAAEVPEKFLGIEQKGGVEKVESLKLKMAEFLRKIEDYQEGIKYGVEKLISDSLKLENVSLPEDFSVKVVLREGLPRDKEQEMRTHSGAVDSGIESRKRAIMEYHGLSEQEAQEEMKKIKEEDALLSPEPINFEDNLNA